MKLKTGFLYHIKDEYFDVVVLKIIIFYGLYQ